MYSENCDAYFGWIGDINNVHPQYRRGKHSAFLIKEQIKTAGVTLTRGPQSSIQKSLIAYTVFQKLRAVSTVVQIIPIPVY